MRIEPVGKYSVGFGYAVVRVIREKRTRREKKKKCSREVKRCIWGWMAFENPINVSSFS